MVSKSERFIFIRGRVTISFCGVYSHPHFKLTGLHDNLTSFYAAAERIKTQKRYLFWFRSRLTINWLLNKLGQELDWSICSTKLNLKKKWGQVWTWMTLVKIGPPGFCEIWFPFSWGGMMSGSVGGGYLKNKSFCQSSYYYHATWSVLPC